MLTNNKSIKGILKEEFSFSTVQITTLAILIALSIVLDNVIHTETVKYSLSFICLAVAGMLYGPTKAGLVAFLADIVSGLRFATFPIPLILLSNVLKGVTHGVLLHKKQSNIRIILVAFIEQLILSWFLTPLGLSQFYGMPYKALVTARVAQVVPLFFIEIIVLELVVRLLLEPLKNIVKQKNK